MKNYVLGITLALTGIILVMIMMTYTSNMTRQDQLDNKLSEACENAVSETMQQNRSYDIATEEGKKALVGAFLQNLSLGLDNNALFTVDILSADADRGLLKVKVTETFKVPKGNTNKYISDCTVILDQNMRYRAKYDINYYIPMTDDAATLYNEEEDNVTTSDGGIELRKMEEEEQKDFDIKYPTCIFRTVTSALGDTYVIPDNPVRSGYVFTGWYDQAGTLFAGTDRKVVSSYPFRILDKVNSPKKLYARFRKA